MKPELEAKKTPRTALLPVAGGVILRDPCAEEVAVLGFVSEQNTVTLTQLARFFGVYVADMSRFAEEMREQGWIEVRRLIKGDPAWVWLRKKGARHAGLGFSAAKPSLRTVGHWHAITDARLYLKEHAPDGVWICERKLRRRRYKGKARARSKGKVKVANRAHIPDALFKIAGEVHAIEVELSRKGPGMLEKIVAQHSSRYDAVVYFCCPNTFTDIKKQELEERFPRLFSCCLVENLRKLTKEEFRDPEDPRNGGLGAQRDPEQWEVAVIDLLAEQGGIPLDQLARYLKCGPARADAIAAHLLEAGFVKRAHPEEEGAADWIWLGTRGARFTTVDVGAQLPALGGLPRLRALNEVRLQILERTKGTVEWKSGRVLRRERGKEGSLPTAVAVEESGRGQDRRRDSYAIDVRLNLIDDLEKLFERYRTRAAEYDWVVWYCAPQARKVARRLANEFDCPKLVVRTIPGYRPPRGTRRRRKPVSTAPTFFEVAPDEVEQEVFEVVALAADREDAIRILSVERRKGGGMKEYRIATNDGTWCVRCTQHGWKATEILV